MKRRFVAILVIFLTSINLIYAQTYPDNTYYERLYYTCKVWGFLKYFHSEVAKGTKNWDAVLFQTLDNVKNDVSNSDFNNTLGTMINSAGRMAQPSTQLPYVTDSLKYNLNLNWLNDPVFLNEIKARLDTVKDWFRPQNNYYVSNSAAGNPTFDNDASYYNNTGAYVFKNYRLLTLFRYWNIINYFYPYKYIMDKNWDSTLVEFIPKMVNVSDEISYNLSFMELAARLNDSHTSTNSSVIRIYLLGFNYLPLTLKYINNETVITGVLENNLGIKPGDIIKSINNVDIQTIRDSLKQYVWGSNDAAVNRNINSFLIRGKSGLVKLTVENNSGQKNVTLHRDLVQADYANLTAKNGPVWKKINAGSKVYGYVDMGRLKPSEVDTMFNDLWNTDAIIFDIRNYPNGTLWYMIYYLFKGPIHIADFTVPDATYPGTMYWYSEYIGSGDFSKTYDKNIYILMDETTQSQAEYTVMGFGQYPKAVKIGSQTAGADGNVSLIYLPGSISTYFTGLGTFYPDHRQTQRIGIVPNVYVYPTIEGIREGKDEVLEAALNYEPTGINNTRNNFQLSNFNLEQNYPNPFNPTTVISYQMPKNSSVTIKVYDLLGRLIRTLVNNKESAGVHQVTFDASDLASGIYFYRMQAGNFSDTKKLILLK